MFSKKKVCLTEGMCMQFETLRGAAEVLAGKPVRIKQIDFGTGKGECLVDGVTKAVEFEFHARNSVDFVLEGFDIIPGFSASYDMDLKGTFEVQLRNYPNRLGAYQPKRWSGTSWRDRKHESWDGRSWHDCPEEVPM